MVSTLTGTPTGNGVFVEPWHGMVMVTVVVRGIDDPTVMRFTLEPGKDTYLEYSRILKSSGLIRIHLLTMVEGDLHRLKSLEAEVPSGALSIIP